MDAAGKLPAIDAASQFILIFTADLEIPAFLLNCY